MAGKVVCVVSGRERTASPEELVRQSCVKALLHFLGYQRGDPEIQFPIKVGSSTRWIDLAVFPPGAPHAQDRIYGVIECKKPKLSASDREKALNQMKSYAASCDNAHFAMLIASMDGRDRQVFEVVRQPGVGYQYVPLPDYPHANAALRDRFTVNMPGGPPGIGTATPWVVEPIAVQSSTSWKAPVVVSVVVLGGAALLLASSSASHEVQTSAPSAVPMMAASSGTYARGSGCVLETSSSFHLRPRATTASMGPEYPARTRVRVLGPGNLVRGNNQIYQVQVESTGAVGYVFLGPEELQGCTQ